MSYPNLFNPVLFRESSILTKLFLVVFVTLSSFLIIGFIFLILAIPIFDIDFEQINQLMKENQTNYNVSFIKYFQATQSIALFVVPSIILSYMLFKKSSNFIYQGRFPKFSIVIIIFLLIIFIIPIIEKLIQLNQSIQLPITIQNKFTQLENEAGNITNKLLSGKSFLDLLINILIVAFIPALGEEFLFRGILQRLFNICLKNGHFAIILSAILFSSIHMQFYGFIPRMVLGILFGYLFFWSNNIWLPVMAHFVNNLITVVIEFLKNYDIDFEIYFAPKQFINESLLLIISSLLFLTLIIFLRKLYFKKIAAQR